MVRPVYDFDQAGKISAGDRIGLLGAKGAGIVRMVELGLPVPPGFIITIDGVADLIAEGDPNTSSEITRAVRSLEKQTARQLGDPDRPLLVSVRSGSTVSMPGMLDTVLNVGLTAEVHTAIRATAPDFATDLEDRFCRARGIAGLSQVAAPDDQLLAAIEAVSASWRSERAVEYRRIEGLSDALGTAVTVQTMVFGNRDGQSASGVLFSQDPTTGADRMVGEFLIRSQGDDVVGGTGTPRPLSELTARWPGPAEELVDAGQALEEDVGGPVEIEFTIDSGRLWLLQVRAMSDPSPTARAPRAAARVLAAGVAASPGVAVGNLQSTVAGGSSSPILVRRQTSPADVPDMAQAAGLITTEGGFASHAAVVARAWGIPAVVGVSDIELVDDGIVVDGRTLPWGHRLTVDGDQGLVLES